MKIRRIVLIILLAALLLGAVVWMFAQEPNTQNAGAGALRFSEAMPSNKGAVADGKGEYPDWIEIHNTNSSAVSLAGYCLTDDITAGAKYVFPSGAMIEANGYVVVWCTGGSGTGSGEFEAPFKINSTETVLLMDSTGIVADTLTLSPCEDGNSLARDASGAWVEMRPSPGFENTEAGISDYEKSLKNEDIGVYISEIMPSNASTLLDGYGEYSDWIELYNSTGAEVDLSGLGLSDSLAQPGRMTIPSGIKIKANEHLIVFFSGKTGVDSQGYLHAPFGLSAAGEEVVISSKTGSIIDSVQFFAMDADKSFARTSDNTFVVSMEATPGYPNTDEGYKSYLLHKASGKGSVYINEVLGKNDTAYPGEDSSFSDCIELYNAGEAAVSLEGWSLSDDSKQPRKWTFPAGTSIKPGEYLVVYATAEEREGLYTSFAISASGESVYMYNAEGALVDALHAGIFLADGSYGLDDYGAVVWFERASIGRKNDEKGTAGVTTVPVFKTVPGIYEEGTQIVIAAAEGESIYYTLDCTLPTADSKLYTEPIWASSNTVVRAVAIRSGYATNRTVSGTFLFKGDGVDHALPVVSLVTEPDNLWNREHGIYVKGTRVPSDETWPYTSANYYRHLKDPSGRDWEREASFSVFDEAGKQVFNQNAAIRIAGSFGTGHNQKGFTVIARDTAGDNRLRYPLFSDLPYTDYKAVTLRAGGQDQASGKIRDELATGLFDDVEVGFLYQEYEPKVLYLNGEYWGVYFMKEKRNRFFVAQHEGAADAAAMDIIQSSTLIVHGSNREWKELMSFVKKNSLKDMENYEYVESQVDLNSFMDYMIAEIYSANSDVHNIQFFKVDGQRWRWIYYDFCWSFGSSSGAYKHNTLPIRRLSSKPASDLFNALLAVESWREAFIERFAWFLENVYAEEKVLAKIDELAGYVSPEIERERAKFNGESFRGEPVHSKSVAGVEKYESQLQKMREFAENRPEYIRKMIQEEFGLSDSYMAEVFG